MYESFYGLKEKPFSMLPDPGFLYLSKKHQMALTLLEYGLLNQSGFCVVSGETGSGKTTLLRKLLENIGTNVTVGMITNTHKGFGGLLDWVLSAFNIHEKDMSAVDMHQRFMDFLLEQYSKNKTTLLIVDEAQNITADKLEELRMLSNVNSEKDQLLQVILAGQPELKDTLQLPELKQFAQRIGVDHHLSALNEEETYGYINHRLSVAGAQREIFTEEACDQIYEYSGGTPRLINLLCDTVMVYGFADQREVIDVDLVDEMVKERMQNSIVPLAMKTPSKNKKPKRATKKKKDRAEIVALKPEKKKPLEELPIEEEAASVSDIKLQKEGARTVVTGFTGKRVSRDNKAVEHGDAIKINEVVMAFDGSVMSPDLVEKEAKAEAEAKERAEAEAKEKVEAKEKAEAKAKTKAEVKAEHESRIQVEQKAEADVKMRGPNTIEVLEPEHLRSIKINNKKLGIAAVIAFLLTGLILLITTSSSNDDSSDKAISSSTQPVPVANEVSDNIKRQLEEAERAREELSRKQREDSARMEALEAASLKLQIERDEARASVVAEKKQREKDAALAKAAARTAQEAQAAKESAIAAALEAEKKNNQLLQSQAEEAARLEQELMQQREAAAMKQQAENLDAAPIVKEKKEESFKTDPCASSTARFLSTCR